MVSTAVNTWGIGETQFLAFYSALCVLVAAGVWIAWQWIVGPADRSRDPRANLGQYKLAILNGGPQLAITAVLANLHDAGLLRDGDARRTFICAGRLPASADRFEREALERIDRASAMSVATLRSELPTSEPMTRMIGELERAGLLLEPAAAKRLRRLWITGAVLTCIGAARVVAVLDTGETTGPLIALVIAAFAATAWLLGKRPHLTPRGRALLRAERVADKGRSRGVALWGSGSLWSSNPGFAATVDAPREGGGSWGHASCGGGSGGGGFFGGGGGGDGGGGFFGGGGSDGGGGGGGGGCGGGGGN